MDSISFRDNYLLAGVAPVERRGEIAFIARLLPETAETILEKIQAAKDVLEGDGALGGTSAITERYRDSDISFGYAFFGSKKGYREAREALRRLPPTGKEKVSAGVYSLSLEDLGYEELVRAMKHKNQPSLFGEGAKESPSEGSEDKTHPFAKRTVTDLPFGVVHVPASIEKLKFTEAGLSLVVSVAGECLEDTSFGDRETFPVGPFSHRSIAWAAEKKQAAS